MAIAAGSMFGLVNIATMVAGKPSYVAAATGIGLGLAALALTTVEHPAHETGLFAAGTFALGTGLIAAWHRHTLNTRVPQARLVPAWSAGSPALALVVDF